MTRKQPVLASCLGVGAAGIAADSADYAPFNLDYNYCEIPGYITITEIGNFTYLIGAQQFGTNHSQYGLLLPVH